MQTKIERGWVNTKIRIQAVNTLRAVASARGMKLIDLFDQVAARYQDIVGLLEKDAPPNGHKLHVSKE
jgi:hypothetical protein